ncbi:phosphatase PAP2/dual specificity phosphatase family protein [Morganella morganii]|uniref:phosphatase PAP2/dual specificity phosphatase family protein n=1 Tax=Morganella morganii TaxID=582 RepID=UPI001A21BE5F|nr:phosphatase PAP2/dual specificity phosphatase family protein [Morganella morganii]MCU6210318.1 phosphatase PAP2/dual specificity phosphatase family protein [Morganella morganii]MCU6223097.1 phosphatase PAP2/dual specificity phosphatase family protein [Morganella morganii]MCU6231753.1 phosphatase PAP2/dual specificity phosphatase family protein [Morganella morganii]MCU6236351.1 phosphatase PAP2/dual specificity phosphatase family protein [Morganella morganii]MCU6273139.1 phosphatase PAP2/dua
MTDAALPLPVSRRKRWGFALLWLLFLAPFFFLTYGQVNTYTAALPSVPSFAFSWETDIPFLPWTIIPYWSIDLFYGLSLFICTSLREQCIHGLRLVVASLAACAGFLLFPLKFSFPRPQTDGTAGWMFDQLEMFDLPFNQAPSLHIILLWLLWLRFRAHTPQKWRWFLHLWSILILISVLTTWQHHFIDVITGAATGVVISYLLPIRTRWQWSPHRIRRGYQLAGRYAVISLVLITAAVVIGGQGWWLLWPGLAFLCITAGYLGAGASVFQKDSAGRISPSAALLLLPYRIAAQISYYWYAKQCRHTSVVNEHIALGGYPAAPLTAAAVLDMTGEFPRSRYTAGLAYHCQPQLDLFPLTEMQIESAVNSLGRLAQSGQVYVHCKLGYTRSTTIVVAWLIRAGLADNVEQALAAVRQARPQIVLREQTIAALTRWAARYGKNDE